MNKNTIAGARFVCLFVLLLLYDLEVRYSVIMRTMKPVSRSVQVSGACARVRLCKHIKHMYIVVRAPLHALIERGASVIASSSCERARESFHSQSDIDRAGTFVRCACAAYIRESINSIASTA